MPFGPIQMLVIGFGPDAQFRGEILEELENLSGRGLIRIIDLLFVNKTQQGDIQALEMSDLTDEEAEELGSIVEKLIGIGAGVEPEMESGDLSTAIREYGIGLEDLQEIANELAPGESAGMLLVEHAWALELRDAIRRAGGVPIAQGFLTPELLLMVGAEVEAIAEAERSIEYAEAVKGAAMLDVLRTVEAAEEIKSAVAADVVRTLIAADLIQDAAAQQAIEALFVAGLIEEVALQEAERAVDEMELEIAEAQALLASSRLESGDEE